MFDGNIWNHLQGNQGSASVKPEGVDIPLNK